MSKNLKLIKNSKTKEVSLWKGKLRIHLPENWTQEDEGGGELAFYEDRPDSGTLRINFLMLLPPQNMPDPVFNMLAADAGLAEVERLDADSALRLNIKNDVEEGIPITLYHWHLAKLGKNNTVNLFIFSYTIATEHEKSIKTKNEIKFLSDSIRKVKTK